MIPYNRGMVSWRTSSALRPATPIACGTMLLAPGQALVVQRRRRPIHAGAIATRDQGTAMNAKSAPVHTASRSGSPTGAGTPEGAAPPVRPQEPPSRPPSATIPRPTLFKTTWPRDLKAKLEQDTIDRVYQAHVMPAVFDHELWKHHRSRFRYLEHLSTMTT